MRQIVFADFAMATDLSEFKGLYVKTAFEYLEKLKTNLAVLMTDPANAQALSEMHISSHSLKSQSLIMGHQTTGKLCAVLEHLFAAVKEQKSQLTPEILQAVQEALTHLEQSLMSIRDQEKELDVTETMQHVAQIAKVDVP